MKVGASWLACAETEAANAMGRVCVGDVWAEEMRMRRASEYAVYEAGAVWANVTVGLLWTSLVVVGLGLWSASDLADCVCPWSDRASCSCLRPCRVSGRAVCPLNDLSFCRLICRASSLVTCLVACPWIGLSSALSNHRASSLGTSLATSCMVPATAPACEVRLAHRLSVRCRISSPSIGSSIGDQMLLTAPSQRVLARFSRPCSGFHFGLRLLGARLSSLGPAVV